MGKLAVVLSFFAVVLLILAVCGFIFLKRKLSMRKLEKEAYKSRLKEQALSQALKNNYSEREVSGYGNTIQPIEKAGRILDSDPIKIENMVVKLTIRGKKTEGYILNPQEHIYIGKATGVNKIVLPDPDLADCHCELFSNHGQVYLRNIHPDYQTVLKRKGRSTAVGLKGIQLCTEDRFQIGAYQIRVTLLDYTGKSIS